MKQGDSFRLFAYYSSIIFVLPACLLTGFVVGDYLDDTLGTYPAMTLVFFLLGAAAAFYEVFRLVKNKP